MASKEREDIEQLNGKDLKTGDGLAPDGSARDSEVGSQSEVLAPNSVEVRIGDPKVDAPRLLQLFTQPATIEHLAGITPETTEDDIRKIYEDPDLVLLTAETPSGLIVGTFSVHKPGFGSRVGEGMRLVVDEKYRDKKIGRKLVKTGNGLLFRGTEDEQAGFGCTKAQIYVIIGVGIDDGIPQRVFGNEGYRRGAENVKTTFSWSNRLQKVVDRNSQPMALDRAWYIQNRRGEHIRYFPQQRLPRVA